MFHIHWLSSYRLDDIHKIKTVNLASVRLRAGALLTAIETSEHHLSLGDVISRGADACVIGKLGANDAAMRGAAWLEEMKRHRALGGKLILDYTDDHLAFESSMSPFYRDAVGLVDICVCSSRLLAKSLSRVYPGRIEVIPDAIEIAAISPKKTAHEPVTILWFGHATNLKYLVDFLPHLKREQKLKLLILTNVEGIKMLQSTPLQIPPNLQIEGAEWGIATMTQAARMCDICIIPSDPTDHRKAGVSSNRLLTALALGLPTAAEKLDSYAEYESFFTDIRSSQLGNFLANPLASGEQVIRAQNGPLPTYAMGKIGQRWIDMISKL